MDIVTYDHVPDKAQYMLLQFQGFQSASTPQRLEEWRQRDWRLKGGPVGFCAVENGQLLGFVGVMDIPHRTLQGEATVGGIWGVVTHPTLSRKGIATALMEAAHQYFRNQGHLFSFLTTYRSYVAYRLYIRLGYHDVQPVDRYPIAYAHTRPVPRSKVSPTTLPTDQRDRLTSAFRRFTANRTGFVVRPPGFLNFAEWMSSSTPLQVDGGYALVEQRYGVAVVNEIVAEDQEAFGLVLDAVASQSQRGAVDPLVSTPELAEAYRRRGYSLAHGRYWVLMAKPLHPNLTFHKTYGDAFYFSRIQSF